MRYAATAVDLENGESLAFDTSRRVVAAEHIRASSALLPAFPPVESDGRLFGDGGLAHRAREPSARRLVASRMQDMMFASQSRRSLATWQTIYDGRRNAAENPAVTVLHIVYVRQQAEVAGKAFDFSPWSVIERGYAGYTDVTAALDEIDKGAVKIGDPRLKIWRPPVRNL